LNYYADGESPASAGLLLLPALVALQLL
jgi:hypothetical protein